MTCAIAQENGRTTGGVVRDVSASGLFVQTGARPTLDSVVEIVLPDRDGRGELRFEAGVARQRRVRGELAASVRSGLGLEILPPRSAIARRLLGADVFASGPREGRGLPTRRAAGVETDTAIRTYRFHMKRHDRPESRVLTIRCETLAGARARALARLGRGWKIARTEPL